jgi:acyl-CoA thioesterase-2
VASDLDKLLKFLEVERIDKYLFIGNSPRRPSRVFGGQVLAQSLNAAIRTVDTLRRAHSMHAYFLRPGNPAKQIVYEVDPIRDGRSFTTRRVVAKQDGVAIFNTSVSFHKEEQGLAHQFERPQVTPPEELESDHVFWTRMAQENPGQVEAPKVQPRPAGRGTVAPPIHRFQQKYTGSQPGPRTVVSPAVPGRRLSAVLHGQPQCQRGKGFQPR